VWVEAEAARMVAVKVTGVPTGALRLDEVNPVRVETLVDGL
jgi:hypothetical protein